MLVQKLPPEENVLRIHDPINFVGAAAIKVEQCEIARSGEGVYSAVDAPRKYSGVFGIKSDPITLGILWYWPAVIENSTRGYTGANDGMTWYGMSSCRVLGYGTSTYRSGASSSPSFARGLQVTGI